MKIISTIRKGIDLARGALAHLAGQGRPLAAVYAWSGRIAFGALIVLLILSIHFVGVTGGSMEPGFHEGDTVMINALGHHLTGIGRGDVIVFTNPHDTAVVDIKRVIGLPRETVQIENGGVTIVHPDGTPETFAAGTLIGGTGTGGNFRMVLGREDFFVLGDNRSKSSDSRDFGAVQPINIIGRVIMRI